MRQRPHRRAFTLVELLLAMAILAMLLASVGVAIHASLHSYVINDRISSLTQAARIVMARLARETRMAVDVDSTMTRLTITPPDDGMGLQKIEYELVGGELHYRRTVSGVTSDSILLGDGGDGRDDIAIETFSVVREEAEGIPLSVKVRLVMTCGGERFAVTASAVLRRNRQF